MEVIAIKTFSVALGEHMAALKQTCEKMAVCVVESGHAFRSSNQPKETSI